MRSRALAALLALALTTAPLETAWAGPACPACDTYKSLTVGGHGDVSKAGNALSMQGVIQHCGPVPTSGTSTGPTSSGGSLFAGAHGNTGSPTAGTQTTTLNQGVDPNFRTGNTDWDNCFQTWIASWGELGQYCESCEKMGHAQEWNYIAAITYTTAATLCGISCGLNAAGVTSGLATFFDYACGISEGASLGVTIKEIIDTNNGKSSDGGFGTGDGLAIGSYAVNVLTIAALLNSDPGSAKVLSCMATGFMVGAAVAKWLSIAPLGDLADNACREATKLAGPAPAPSTKASTTPTGDPDIGTVSQPLVVGGGGGTATGGGSGGKGGSGGLYARTNVSTNRLFDPKIAQATAGPFYPLMKNFANPAEIDHLLGTVGASVGDIAKRLAAGQSPAQIAGGISGLSQSSSMLDDIQKAVETGKLKVPGGGDASALLSSSGGGGGKAGGSSKAANPFMFGMKGPGGGGAPTETAFEKAKRALASEPDGDIWHEGFGGTIFQIVSGKIDKTRDRIDQLEWDTPLNRALVGLPARRAPAKAH